VLEISITIESIILYYICKMTVKNDRSNTALKELIFGIVLLVPLFTVFFTVNLYHHITPITYSQYRFKAQHYNGFPMYKWNKYFSDTELLSITIPTL
jgi:hypothetical protein